LPSGLTDQRANAGAVFDRIASLYDRARPGYPVEAVRDLDAVVGIAGSGRILEIGCGTGQLTRDLAPTGVAIDCLEPGPSLAATARANLAGYPNVTVTITGFEDFDASAGSYDVVVSATAFHWIDPCISYAKASSLLRPGGHLALLTNAHSSGGTHTDPGIAKPIRALHRRLAPEVGDWTFADTASIQRHAAAGGDIAAVWARMERKLSEPPAVSDLFEPPTVRTYPWVATYDTESYLAMLATQSSYALIESARRDELLQRIGQLIDALLGGVITKEYVTILAVAETTAAAEPDLRFRADLYRGTAARVDVQRPTASPPPSATTPAPPPTGTSARRSCCGAARGPVAEASPRPARTRTVPVTPWVDQPEPSKGPI
jgi:SAM-dependent methyltransferase